MKSDYDVAVIGGGPAGLFAAGFAAGQGARVVLLEKNARCGAKLLITGKGRCNITNNEADPRRLVENFGRQGKALLTALYAFGVEDVLDFFEQRGLALQVERGGRVFPARGGAAAVLKVLEQFVKQAGVELRAGCAVTGVTRDDDGRLSVATSRGKIGAAAVVVATGGLSYPQTGSSGDGYRWAQQLGHRLVTPQPALVPLKLKEAWTDQVCDFNLKNVRISLLVDGQVRCERFGEAFFTRNGIGGPIVLDLSTEVRPVLNKGHIELSLDLKPAVERDTFDRRLQRELTEHSNRDFRNSLAGLLPRALIPIFLNLSGIDPFKKCHSVSREERLRLLGLFKELRLTVTGCEGFGKAIITTGGLALPDLDMRTMASKRVEGLFVAGELIDLDGPTGGYNLQLCWSTGYLAGIEAAKWGLSG